MLVNIQTTSERADKKVWENNGLSGSNSDVVIANENSFDLALIYPLKCLKTTTKKRRRRRYLPNTGQQSYQQGCQQGRELSVSVVLVEQLRGGQWFWSSETSSSIQGSSRPQKLVFKSADLNARQWSGSRAKDKS